MEGQITVLLSRLAGGDRAAFDQLVPLVYRELHRIAESYLRREAPGHLLQPTELIHEAYLRMAGHEVAAIESRAHFYAVAARVMRQILVDNARTRGAAKRAFGQKVPFEEGLEEPMQREGVVASLDEALEALAREDESRARWVEMRFFGGMTAEEIAQGEGVPAYTVRRKLRLAQIWLRREMARDGCARRRINFR